MTKSNDGWVPEVGEICQAYFENHPCIDDGWSECEILKAQSNTDNPYAVLCDGTLAWVFQVKELKTEAEKRRDEQVAFMNEVCLEFHSNKQIGLSIGHCLYEAGVRAPSDNQFIATKLSDEDITKIACRYLPTAERMTAKEVAALVRVFMGQPS